MEKTILIIEDEKNICDILSFNLQKEGYRTEVANDGETGLNSVLERDFDLVMLDVMLPKIDGFEVCRRVRKRKNTPIIMLTARVEEVDKILGLDLGADDYITKPFSMKELLARVKANIRRAESEPVIPSNAIPDTKAGVLQFGDLRIDQEKYVVYRGETQLELTLREYELLRFLSGKPGKVFSREDILKNVWGYEGFYGDLRNVDVMIRRLREKLEVDSVHPKYIHTRRGAGYYFNDENEA